jgi:hypothetical protein
MRHRVLFHEHGVASNDRYRGQLSSNVERVASLSLTYKVRGLGRGHVTVLPARRVEALKESTETVPLLQDAHLVGYQRLRNRRAPYPAWTRIARNPRRACADSAHHGRLQAAALRAFASKRSSSLCGRVVARKMRIQAGVPRHGDGTRRPLCHAWRVRSGRRSCLVTTARGLSADRRPQVPEFVFDLRAR